MSSPKATAQDVEVLKGLLRKLAQDEAYWQGQVIARKLVELVQNDPEVWYLYGHIQARLGEHEAAFECLSKALDIAGPRVEIAREMCWLERAGGNLGKAIEWCRRGLELIPADADFHREMADLHARLGEPEKAIQVLEIFLRMPALEPDDVNAAKEDLGRLYMDLRQFDEALGYFRQVAEADDENDVVWANIGHCLSRQGDTTAALEAFKHAVDKRLDAHNLYNLGDAYLAAGRVQDAIAPLVAAIRNKPDFALAHYNLGLAYFELGRFEEAAREARLALAADPDMVTAEMNLGLSANAHLGLSLMNQEKYEEAIQCFKKNEKEFAATFFNMGLALFRAKRNKEALDYFKRATAIRPDDAEFLDLLGQTYTELGNYAAAEKHLRRSIELGPDEYWGYYDLGNLFLRLKDKRKEAKALLTRAIELAPDFMWSYYCLGCWYALEGKKAQAFEWLEKALEKGFKDLDWIEKDKDLDGLRKDPRYAKLLGKLEARNGQEGAEAKAGEGKKEEAREPAPKKAAKAKKAKKAVAKAKKAAD